MSNDIMTIWTLILNHPLESFRTFLGIVWVFSAYKWSDWRNWKNYYSTILFFDLGDFIYNFLTYNYPLWELRSPTLKVSFLVIVTDLIYWPSSILIFLTHFPERKTWRKILYTLTWVALFQLIELIIVLLGGIQYYHGWNFWYSLLFNLVMFPLFKIHFDHPLLAWFLAAVMGITIISYFKIPLSSMK